MDHFPERDFFFFLEAAQEFFFKIVPYLSLLWLTVHKFFSTLAVQEFFFSYRPNLLPLPFLKNKMVHPVK